MTVVPDADRQGHPPSVDVDSPVEPPPAGNDQAAELAERLRAGRRARRRTRLQQAVSARRRSLIRWSDQSSRLIAGLALLLLMMVVAGGGIMLLRQPSLSVEPAEEVRARKGLASPVAALAVPTVAPSPRATPEVTPGPAVSIAMIEANGPTDGCTLHSRFGALSARVGQALVGQCVEVPQPGAGGDVRQRTEYGELFWYEADSRAAFTDGAHVWLTGPGGIVRRRIGERFAWERDADAGPKPASTTYVMPPSRPGAMLPARRIVSYYGNPLATGMGILGELPTEELFPRLREQSDAYKVADRGRPVTPALELVAVVAQPEPGPDGLYRLRMAPELIEQVSAWAEEHGFLLILDVQIGRGSVDDEVRWLLPFLKRPHVHLALDPEFAMPAGRTPGERVGTMDAAAINGAMRTVARLVEIEGLPPKMLLVHRFTEGMVTGWRQIAADPRVQVVMVMDGFGTPPTKARQYVELIAEQRVQYTGFKLFYRHDEPLMTPEEVLQLDPAPDLIIYQ